MIQERKPEEFEDDRKNWDIYFDINLENNHNERSVFVKFSKKAENIKNEDLTKLKQDIKDLGKFRIIKEGRRFLEN